MRCHALALFALAILVVPASAFAALVGDIQVVYFAPNSFGISPFLDGPAFIIENTSGAAITNGVLSLLSGTADSFSVGTIAAGGNVIVEPGISNDGGSHPPGGFFATTGSILDTSDSGPDADTTQFRFTGLQGGLTVDSGIFTPAATRRQSNDNTVSINFLGLEDAPCQNCFGPAVVANLNTLTSTVPEPSTPSSWARALSGWPAARGGTATRSTLSLCGIAGTGRIGESRGD